MGMYSSHVFFSYEIPKKLYNYLLPIYGLCATRKEAHIHERNGKFYFVGNKYHYSQMLKETEFIRIDENIILLN